MREFVLGMQRLDRGAHTLQISNLHPRQEFCFELVLQDQIRIVEQGFVDGQLVFVDVYAAVVAHYGVEDPEEGAGFGGVAGAERSGDFAYFLDQSGGGAVAGQHHVETVEAGALEAGVKGGDFFGGGFAAFEAAVGDVVACGLLVIRCLYV